MLGRLPRMLFFFVGLLLGVGLAYGSMALSQFGKVGELAGVVIIVLVGIGLVVAIRLRRGD